MSSGSRNGPPSTPRPGGPNVAVNTLTKNMQPLELIPAGTVVTLVQRGVWEGRRQACGKEEVRSYNPLYSFWVLFYPRLFLPLF